MRVEKRVNAVDFELRDNESGGSTFTGYAAVFNSPSEPLPFTEIVAPGAFARSLKSRNDVKLLWNHDAGQVLGSTRAKTVRLVEDGKGLRVEADLPNTTLGNDTRELIKRGDVDSMSFGFSTIRDKWSSEGSTRTLEAVRLHEVSIVAFPAYTATAGTTSVRSLFRLALRAEVDAEALADAMLKLEAGEQISDLERDVLTKAIDTLAPVHNSVTIDPEPAEPVTELGDMALLELKRAKLRLLTMGLG
jgi:HK97 family phage prohead protease